MKISNSSSDLSKQYRYEVPAEQAHSWRRKGKQTREYSCYRQNKHTGVMEQVPQRYRILF